MPTLTSGGAAGIPPFLIEKKCICRHTMLINAVSLEAIAKRGGEFVCGACRQLWQATSKGFLPKKELNDARIHEAHDLA